MKEVYFMIGLVFLFYACSSPDEGKSALVSNDIEGRPSVELVSVYEDDALVLNIDKMNRSYDVTCSCMFWADVLIKGNLSFDKIQISGNVFSVLENDL